MNPKLELTDSIETERYELHAEPLYQFDVTRRDFCRILGGGLLVMLVVPKLSLAQESGRGGRGGNQMPDDLGAWIRIAEDGKVHVSTGKVEVGQGIRTSLAQAVAEELHVPLESITMVMGDTMLTPPDRGTFGSQTTPRMAPQLRRAAAAAREALIDLAAESWKVSRDKIVMKDGMLTSSEDNQKSSFADLANGRMLTRQISADLTLSKPQDWTVAGQPAKNTNGAAIVTGAHIYPGDLRTEGMLYGRVLRPPSPESRLVSADISAAEKMPGVVVVKDQNFLGVTAPTPGQAQQAVDAIKAEWSAEKSASDADVFAYYKTNAGGGSDGRRGGNDGPKGDIAAGLAAAAKKLEASYEIAYIAHAPLETRAALASWEGDKLTASVGTQRPFGVRSDLAQAFSIPEEKVRVIMPDTGSGYGGKHSGEAAVEAARLAKAAGKPVKVVWTREEEFTSAYCRPGGLIEVKSGIAADGKLTAWEFHNWNSGGTGIGTPYEVANQHTQFHSTKSPLRQGSYRALASTANHFARESHMDELAAAAGMDPYQFRLANLTNERLRTVLDAVAKAINWQSRVKKAGHGFGIACGAEKGGYVATAVELKSTEGSVPVKLLRIVTAFECGTIVNPDNLQNQVEGAVVQGIGGAMTEIVRFTDGKVINPAFRKYRVPRFDDVPPMETILLDRKDIESAGAGESPIVAIAPAIANAVFEATGKRLRSMPLFPKGT